MLKMMTYGEANEVLDSSLTPTNRCLTKSVAISAGAGEDALTDYASNRLVPANVIEPADIEAYFVLEDGTLALNPTVYIPLDQVEYTVRTVVYLNGELVKEPEYWDKYWAQHNVRSSSWDMGTLFETPFQFTRSYDSSTGIFSTHFNDWITREDSIGVEGAYGTMAFDVYKGINETLKPGHTITITFIRNEEPPTPSSYTIRFLDDDGTVLSTQSVEEGTMPTAPSDPTKEDYNFNGWSPAVAAATQDQDYTATYTLKPYRITFRDDSQFGGDIITDHYYNAQENPVIPDAPQHTGYTHTGWIPQVGPVSSNATYYATYQGEQPTEYTIRFLTYNGTVISTQQCESGTTPTAPIAPFRPGYTFVGWTPSVGPATRDQDYTATYVEDSSIAKVNVQITNSTGQVVHVNDIISVAGSRESEFWFDNVQINNGSTYTKNDFDYYDEGNTINTVYAEYSKGSSGTYQRVEIPSADWHCTMGTELSDGDTLYVTLRS